MKPFFFALIFLSIICTSSSAQDSSLHERFVVSLLNEYEKTGQWIFVEIDSCNSKKDYQVVNTMTIFKSYSETHTIVDKEQFIWETSESIRLHGQFGYCPESDRIYGLRKYYITGIKVNMQTFHELEKLPISKILSKYFDKKKKLKKEFREILYELVAVCYVNNIKVITSSDGNAVYKIFK